MLIGEAKLLGEEGFDEELAKTVTIEPEKLDIVVHTIFRKAQTEHTYSNFYCKLCSTIVRIELTSKGLRAIPANLKHCDFRRRLLDYCKSCFEDFFTESDPRKEAEEAGKAIDEEAIKEKVLKRKHKLFGNIEFVGELHKEYLLSDSIAKSVFSTLLKPDTFTDDTIEAAIKFIEKVGPGIEERILASKKTFTQEHYDEILQNFAEIMAMTEEN